MAAPAYSPRAISAAVAYVRRVTRNPDWHYQNGEWFTLSRRNGALVRRPALPFQATRFNAYLDAFAQIHPLPLPPAPPAPPPPSGGRNGFAAGVGSIASGTGGALARGARSLAGAGGAALNAPLMPLQIGLTGLVLVVGGLATAIKSATVAATGYAKTLSTLRANNGLSFAQGYGLTSRNSLFGISPERTAAIYGDRGMNPMIANARSRGVGFAGPYGDLAKQAEQYQAVANRGPMGRIEANNRLDAAYGGNAPDEIRVIVNLPAEKIRQQQAYGQQVQRQMGISPEMLRKYAEDIPLAAQRIGFAVEQAKLKLAVELAPFIERTFGGIAAYIGKNSGKIAAAIKRGVSWLIEDLPPLILRFGIAALRGFSAFLAGFSAFSAGMAANAMPILQTLNVLLNVIKNFATDLLGVARVVGGGAASAFQAIPQPVKDFAVNNPLAAAVGTTIAWQGVKTGGKAIAGRIIGGGAAAAAGAGAGAAGGALAPLAGGLAVGVGLGYAADRYGQSTGALNSNQSFGSRMAYGWGTLRDRITNNPGHYDRMAGTYGEYIAGPGTDRPGTVGVDEFAAAKARNAVGGNGLMNSITAANQSAIGSTGSINIATQQNATALADALNGISKMSASGSEKADSAKDTLERILAQYPALIKEIQNGNKIAERNGDRMAGVIGSSGQVLTTLKNSLGRDAYLAAVR